MYRIIILSPFLSVWCAPSLSCHLKMAASLCPHIISSCDTSLPLATCHMPLVLFYTNPWSTQYKSRSEHYLPYIHHYNDFWRILSSEIWPHVVWYVGTLLGGIFSTDDGSSSCLQSICTCASVYTVPPCKKTDLWSWPWEPQISHNYCYMLQYRIFY